MCSSRVADPRPWSSLSARKFLSERISRSSVEDAEAFRGASASKEWTGCAGDLSARVKMQAVTAKLTRFRDFSGYIKQIIETEYWASLVTTAAKIGRGFGD
jgi:hypothetical protein